MRKIHRLLWILTALISVACSSTTVITSVPEGAAVYLNGERVGMTPFTYSDRKMFGSNNLITLKKEGYEDFVTLLSKDEEINAWAIAGGILLVVPILWAMEYKPQHTYELVPLRSGYFY